MAIETIHQRLERERKAALPEANLLRDFRAYAKGNQRSTLTAAQQGILRGVTGRRFCDNVCKMVLAASTSRLQLLWFSVADAEVQKWLADFWTLAQLPLLSKQTHWAALRDGNHAVALSWDSDKNQVRLARERWWDGKSGIFIAYDDTDRPAYAVKEWTTWDKRQRRVIWWPNRIERYIQQGEGWQQFALDENNPAITPWTANGREDGEPLGLPVVHFRNVYMPNDSSDDDTDSSYGVSELDGGVLGLQDEINDIQRDITSGARYTGYQMLYGTGITLPEDEAGNTVPPKVEPGAFFHDANADASYGTLPAGDLAELERAHNIKLRAVSRMTSTPMYQIGGDWPSGDALEQADEPLIAKVESMVQSFGPSWASVAHKATLLSNAFGGTALDTGALIVAKYASPAKRSPFRQAQFVNLIAPHVSEEEILRELGKSPDEIKNIQREKQAQKKRNMAMMPQVPARGQGGNEEDSTDKDDAA